MSHCPAWELDQILLMPVCNFLFKNYKTTTPPSIHPPQRKKEKPCKGRPTQLFSKNVAYGSTIMWIKWAGPAVLPDWTAALLGLCRETFNARSGDSRERAYQLRTLLVRRWWISHWKGSRGQDTAPFLATMLEDPLVSTGRTEARISISNSKLLHRNVPQSSATLLCSSPTIALPWHGSTFCGIRIGWTRLPVWCQSWVAGAPSDLYFSTAGGPAQEQDGLPFPFGLSLRRVKLHLKLTQ